MGELVKVDAIFSSIESIVTEEEMREAIKQLDVLKSLLEAADRFREESVKFARCEAHALARAVEIMGNTSLIKGKWRKLAAEWLANMDPSERETYIAKCSDGKTIDNIYKEMIYEPAQRSALGDAVSACKVTARNMLRTDGVVNVQEIVRKHSARFPKSMLKEITDGVRAAVRDAGGVGIGDNTGVYIDPDKESNYISDAIAVRVEAVSRDMESIADLASRCESKPTFCIKGSGETISYVDLLYITLACVGCAHVSFDSSSAKRSTIRVMRSIVGDMDANYC